MKSGAEFIVEVLEEYGVERVFGNPGTTELPLVNAIPDSDVEYTMCLHEDVAVGAAAGYASTMRYHREDVVGFANLHVAPGLAHGLGNIHGSKYSGVPLVVTAGNHATDFEHEEPILAGDMVKMTEDFTKWSAEVKSVDALPGMLRRAFRVALTPPTGPVFLALPMDVTTEEADHDVEPLGSVPEPGDGADGDVEEAVEAVANADSLVLVVGDGVARGDGVDDAVALAEATGARVHGEIFTGEGNYPTSHPQWVSFLPPRARLTSTLLDVDTAVFLGCSTNSTLWKENQDLVGDRTTCVEVSNDGWQIGKNMSADVSVLGDPGRVAGQLAEELESRVDDDTRENRLNTINSAKQMVEAKIKEMDHTEGNVELPTKYDVVEALNSVAPDAFVVDEGVTSKYALLTQYDIKPESYIGSKGGGLGYGLPAAVGAAVAHQDLDLDRRVLGFVGDGSYLYYPQSIYTAVREGLDLTVVVPDNRSYRILKDNTLDLFGGDEEDYEFPGMDLPDIRIEESARSYGAEAERVDDVGEVEPALEELVESDEVGVLDVQIPGK